MAHEPPPLHTELRTLRTRAGLSQQALADAVGVSRQAILAVEAGRQVPSTVLALRLARALAVPVEALFALPEPGGLEVELAPDAEAPDSASPCERVHLGRVRGRWVAHRLPAHAFLAADGVLQRPGAADGTARVEPLLDIERLSSRLLIAGCAPLLGLLAGRPEWGVTWLEASSGRALDLLDAGLVHVAGLHASGASTRANEAVVRAHLAGRSLRLVHLTRWRQGLLTAPGNPLGLTGLGDLVQPGLRFARRAPGAGATRLVCDALDGGPLPEGPTARGHAEVARLVQLGVADAGVAIESVAVAAGLEFLPLSEERFDLVLSADLLDDARVQRLLDGLAERGFRTEAARLPAYDLGQLGDVRALDEAS